MQTFLPYPDFEQSAQCLDNKRLGKQRIETLQILRTLSGLSKGWQNHPAVKMWRGYEGALARYGGRICSEWVRRGFKDTTAEKILNLWTTYWLTSDQLFPPWFGGPIHSSHRSNLLRKDPKYYGRFGWEEGPDLPYYWPTKEEGGVMSKFEVQVKSVVWYVYQVEAKNEEEAKRKALNPACYDGVVLTGEDDGIYTYSSDDIQVAELKE